MVIVWLIRLALLTPFPFRTSAGARGNCKENKSTERVTQFRCLQTVKFSRQSDQLRLVIFSKLLRKVNKHDSPAVFHGN